MYVCMYVCMYVLRVDYVHVVCVQCVCSVYAVCV